jgi:hypothetical protein
LPVVLGNDEARTDRANGSRGIDWKSRVRMPLRLPRLCLFDCSLTLIFGAARADLEAPPIIAAEKGNARW